MTLTDRVTRLLRWSERFTGTDMVYLATGGFWVNLGSLTGTLFSFVLYVAFAHAVPKEVYGTYQYLLSIAALVGSLTMTGMSTAVAQAVARGYDRTYEASLPVQFRWALVPLVGACLGALYYYVNGNASLALGLLLIGLSLPITTTFNTYSALLSGKKDFRRMFWYNFALNVPYYGLLIATAFLFKNALALLAVSLGVQAVMLALLHWRTKRTYPAHGPTDESALRYGTHLSVMGVLSAVANQLDNVLVFHFLGPVDLAIYAFATAIPDRAASFLRFFSITALPKFAEKTDIEIRATIGPKLIKLAAFALLGAIVYMGIAPFFFALVFPHYSASVPFSALYALSMLGVVAPVALAALTAQKHTRELYIYNSVTPVLQLMLQYGGIVAWGLWGLVAAKTASTVLTSIIATVLYLRRPQAGPRS